MAACGIAEHNEALRKERTGQKVAFKKKVLMKSLQDQIDQQPHLFADVDQHGYTYMGEDITTRTVRSSANILSDNRHDAVFVDRMKRNQLRQQQQCEYSAKIPNRFSSLDYAAQW